MGLFSDFFITNWDSLIFTLAISQRVTHILNQLHTFIYDFFEANVSKILENIEKIFISEYNEWNNSSCSRVVQERLCRRACSAWDEHKSEIGQPSMDGAGKTMVYTCVCVCVRVWIYVNIGVCVCVYILNDGNESTYCCWLLWHRSNFHWKSAY